MCVGNVIVFILLVVAVSWWVVYMTASAMAIKELQEDYRNTRKEYWDLRREVERLKDKQEKKKGGTV